MNYYTVELSERVRLAMFFAATDTVSSFGDNTFTATAYTESYTKFFATRLVDFLQDESFIKFREAVLKSSSLKTPYLEARASPERDTIKLLSANAPDSIRQNLLYLRRNELKGAIQTDRFIVCGSSEYTLASAIIAYTREESGESIDNSITLAELKTIVQKIKSKENLKEGHFEKFATSPREVKLLYSLAPVYAICKMFDERYHYDKLIKCIEENILQVRSWADH